MVIQTGVLSPGQPAGRPLIITIFSTPSSFARRKVFSVTPQSFWKARGLPEQFRAHRAISRRRSWSIQRCRAVSEPSSSSKSMWGAPDHGTAPLGHHAKKVRICKALRGRNYDGSSTRHGTIRTLLQDKLFEVRRNCSKK